ncbi:MAG TPA: MBL fold metallo-hydrolase, partial [Candidatus Glassbacteria bacterium]|nr:MBL fold metallo-hydrolase [Candidatus Glassbacteria bacterium]
FCSCRNPVQSAGAEPPAVRQAEDFPFDPERRHDRDFTPSGRLSKICDNLYRLEDACNVYVVKSGDAALLVDFGAGAVTSRLAEIGVSKIEKMIATHHHRDQVQGLVDLGSYDFEVVVPEAEAQYFENVEQFWLNVPIYINYNCRSHWNTIRRSIRVDGKVKGGDRFTWRGIEFEVIDTPGSSNGAVSYAATIDGRRVVFSGDLIAGAGKVTNWFDLHWDYYGFTQGMEASRGSFERVREAGPEWLLPSHGGPIEKPAEAFETNLAIYAKLADMLIPNELGRQKQFYRQLLPHLYYVGMNCYAIVSESGKAFLYDFGYVNHEMMREFRQKSGVKEISAVSFSHYHDDHNIRAYELYHDTYPEIWIFENMQEVFEHPSRFKLPCLVPFPIKADRVLHDGQPVQWEEYTLDFFYMPGQTEFHQGLVTEIDGKKVMFTGDNTWNKLWPDKRRNGPLVPHNEYFLDGGFITCASKMIHYLPDMVCPAHTEEYFPTKQDLEEFLGWARELREVMTGLIDQPDPNFGMDYRWCRFYPYRTVMEETEDQFTVEVMVRNHLFRPAEVKLELKYPDTAFECAYPVRTFTIEPKKQAGVPFVLKKRLGAPAGREVLTVDITINGQRIGEYTEGLVDM